MRPTRRTITWVLAAHLVLCWTAVVLRIDRFPLTWAPMYSVYSSREARDEYKTMHKDRKAVEKRGWKATHADGTTSRVPRAAINVQKRSMWRLYYQRTFGKGPPKIKQLNHDAGTLDRWLWGLGPGDEFESPNWSRRLLTSVNKTLGHAPGDPKFIVRLVARAEWFVFDGQTYEFQGKRPRKAVAKWKDEWAGDFR
ncbi:MAG: hypothetical protein ACQGVK_20390 [Myxococcota bacterium]